MALPRRLPPTQGAARKELTYDTMRDIGKLADFFIHMCDTHPELIKEYYMGTYAKEMCMQVEAGLRPGQTFDQYIQWTKENMADMTDRIAGPRG